MRFRRDGLTPSFGAERISTHLANGRSPESVAGFILESGFVDLGALVERRGMPSRKFVPGDAGVFDPRPKLARGQHPLLVLHGALDDLIAPAEAAVAFATAGTEDKTLVVIESRGHNDISESEQYWQAIESFTTRVAKGG